MKGEDSNWIFYDKVDQGDRVSMDATNEKISKFMFSLVAVKHLLVSVPSCEF